MRLVVCISILILLAVEVGALESDKKLTLVDNGVPQITIVAADKELKAAADELSGWLKRISGADVPVAADGDVKTAGRITLKLSARTDLPIDGYRVMFPPDGMVISGPSVEAVENGVYGFLQDYLGVRWYLPGELFTIVPKQQTVEVSRQASTHRPNFGFRVFSGVTGPDAAKWQAAMRLSRNRVGIPYFGFGHNLKNIFKVSVYGKDHPEYYALIDGKRFVPANDHEERSQPCFTNPEVIEITAKAAHDYFTKNPKATTFSLCINDNADFCTCDNCRKLDEPMRHSVGPQHSDSYFYYVKEVAERVLKTDPGKYLGVYAYWGVELTPRNIDKLPENVVVELTQDTSQYIDPEYEKKDRDLWLAWSEKASHLAKYDYYGLGWFTPRSFCKLAAKDLDFIHANKAIGFYCEVYPMWAVTGPQVYIAARRMWDLDLDANKLMDEFCNNLFGPAAGEMRAFYDTCERYWSKPRKGQWFQGLDRLQPEMPILQPEVIDEAWKHLQSAKAKASGIERERVDWVIDRFRFTYSLSNGFRLANDIQKAVEQNKPEAEISKMVEMLKKNVEETKAAADFLHSDPLHKHSYYEAADRFNNKFSFYLETAGKAMEDK